MIRAIKTVDAHVGGQPLRLIVEGVPVPAGKTSVQQRDWWRRNADTYRRSLILEPRGHLDMTAALLTPPTSPAAHAGLVFMDAAGYPSMSGHGVIATATIALERGLIVTAGTRESGIELAFDTPAGMVHAHARTEAHGGRVSVDSVAMTNVPSFVYAPAIGVRIGAREVRVDVAFGGAFYAIVDTEAVGVPLSAARLPDLRRLGVEICESAAQALRPAHPLYPSLGGIAGVVFTGPATDPEAHLRNVTVKSGGSIDRSPGGTGTSAVMAVLDAMGLLGDGQPFVHEGITGSLIRGRAVQRTVVGELPALVTEIEGAAWITGEHTFLLDEDDPLEDGVST